MADGDVIVHKSQYDDFSVPTAARSFEIRVESKSLFLNPGWLAELSPFFTDFCFGDSSHKNLRIDDICYADMLEFFRCICFCPQRKPLSISNVAMVMRCATRFEMRPVMARCDRFVSVNAQSLDRRRLFQVANAMSSCDPNSTTMSVLVDRLASIKEEDLSDMNFEEMPGQIVADVYREKIRRRARNKQRWLCPLNWLNCLRPGRRPRNEHSHLNMQ